MLLDYYNNHRLASLERKSAWSWRTLPIFQQSPEIHLQVLAQGQCFSRLVQCWGFLSLKYLLLFVSEVRIIETGGVIFYTLIHIPMIHNNTHEPGFPLGSPGWAVEVQRPGCRPLLPQAISWGATGSAL